MDISKQLHAYEVEYHVLQDEMLDPCSLLEDSERLDKLEKTNIQLKKQNMDLLEKLQARKKRISLFWICNKSTPFLQIMFFYFSTKANTLYILIISCSQ